MNRAASHSVQARPRSSRRARVPERDATSLQLTFVEEIGGGLHAGRLPRFSSHSRKSATSPQSSAQSGSISASFAAVTARSSSGRSAATAPSRARFKAAISRCTSVRRRARSSAVSGQPETAPTNLSAVAATTSGFSALVFVAAGETVSETDRVSENRINPAPKRAKKTPGPASSESTPFPPAKEKSPVPLSRPRLPGRLRKKAIPEIDQQPAEKDAENPLDHP